MRRLSGPVAAGIAALVAVLLAIAVAAPASAAQLTVRASHPVINTAARCSTVTLPTTTSTASTTSSTLTISNVPAACVGKTITVRALNGSGASLATGTVTAATAGANSVTMTSYNTANVASVVVLFNGWWSNTSWTAPVPTPALACKSLTIGGGASSAPCSVTGPSVNSWGQGSGPFYMNFSANVTTTAPNFEIVINFADTSVFPGWTPVSIVGNSDSIAAPGYSCSELPILRLVRNTSNSSFSVYLQASTLPNASAGHANKIC